MKPIEIELINNKGGKAYYLDMKGAKNDGLFLFLNMYTSIKSYDFIYGHYCIIDCPCYTVTNF